MPNKIRPHSLVHGRTSLGINVPVRVDTDGILQTSGSGGGSGDASAANQTSQITQETAINTVLGVKTDAKNTATDATSVSAVSIWKQISASMQSLVSSVVTLGATTASASVPVAVATDDTMIGSKTETAPTTDTASSGLNGRLQRVAQRITSMIALLPSALGAGGGLKVDGSGTALPISGTVTASNTTGSVAHDGADSGNPVKVGGRARSSEIAAVASDDRVDFVTDLAGKQIVLVGANPENFVSGAITSAMTGTTSTSCLAAPASGLRNYITGITVSNASITVPTDIVIQDGSGGATLYTVPCPIGTGTGTGTSGGHYVFPTPIRQPTTATAIYVANVTTGSSTKVSMVGYKGV